jgi:putative heme degradation protein
MEAIGQTLDLFGEKRVFVGGWNEPICVNGLTAEEVTYARKFFDNMGCEVKEIT